MRKTILTRIISVLIAVIMLVGALPLTAISVLAAEADNNKETAEPQKELSVTEAIEKEMAERSPITKDRSEIKPTSQAAVYVDGKLYREGDFSPMWNVAMEKAAYVNPGEGQSNQGRSQSVEYVLNKNFRYDESWFSEGTMTISNKYFTIDLNGCVLRRSDDGGSVIRIIDKSVVTIMDSDPTKENPGYMKENNLWSFSIIGSGTKNIKGGVISGGYHSTGDGGGLYINDQSIVYMTGGTIAGNKADVGSGVYLGGGSSLDMSRGTSQICYNYSAGTISDGGAIFLRPDCSVTGGYVHHNLADDYGGGIRAKGGNIAITDVVVYENHAREYGGGIYVERSEKEQIVTISGCRIISNHAPNGGGVYLWDLDRTNMVSCVVEENTSIKNGAGIYVSCGGGTDLSISGEMIVRNNYEKKDKNSFKSNLYLEGDDDLIVGSLSLDSEVWIKTGSAPKDFSVSDSTSMNVVNSLLQEPTGTSHLFFFSDADGYCIKYQDDPAKNNYRHLYLAKGTRNEDGVQLLKDYETKKLDTPYTIESGAHKGASTPLYKGYCEFDMMSSTDFISASPFYYSDGYFFEDPTEYNRHLATMSMNLAVSAFGRYTDLLGDDAYAIHFANVKQLLSDIGCADSNFYVNDDFHMKPAYYGEERRLSTIAVAISQKEIELNGETYTLVPIAIRGAGYETEWASNVSIGKTGEAKGFADAADQVFNHVEYYVDNYGLSDELEQGKLKFWVVGYSRAGATANLTAKRLVDNHAFFGNTVFGYTFEAPRGGVKETILEEEHTAYGTYPTIHNTVNEADFVTYVAPSDMGFIRYGVDHLIGCNRENGDPVSYDVNSAYYKQRMKMIAQLNAINPYYKFDDSWEVADVNIILGNLPFFATDIIDKGEQWWDDPNPECENISRYLPWFFTTVVGYGLQLPTKEIDDPKNPNNKIVVFDMTNAREQYSENKPLAKITGNDKSTGGVDYIFRNLGYSDMSIEEAAASLVSLAMGGLTDEQMDALMVAVMTNAGILKETHTTIHKWDQGLFDRLFEETGVFGAPVDAVISVIVPFVRDLSHILDLYNKLINDWDERSELEKSQSINWLMHSLLDGSASGGTDVWSILTEEQAETVANALPVLLWFVLNYASRDYNDTDDDDGMWGTGTFINNMSAITSNHYQEVTMAWVRSYDSDFYANDLQAYTIDKSSVETNAPTGAYAKATKTLSISADKGSSVFYSVDGGENWILYTGPTQLEEAPNTIMCFSISRGVKSEVAEILTNPWAGTILGNGNVWFLIIGSAFIVGACIVGFEANRKKKKATNKN